MAKKTLRVKVSEEQFKLICSKANYYDFPTISSYIRNVALKDINYMKMLREIHEKLCK